LRAGTAAVFGASAGFCDGAAGGGVAAAAMADDGGAVGAVADGDATAAGLGEGSRGLGASAGFCDEAAAAGATRISWSALVIISTGGSGDAAGVVSAGAEAAGAGAGLTAVGGGAGSGAGLALSTAPGLGGSTALAGAALATTVVAGLDVELAATGCDWVRVFANVSVLLFDSAVLPVLSAGLAAAAAAGAADFSGAGAAAGLSATGAGLAGDGAAISGAAFRPSPMRVASTGLSAATMARMPECAGGVAAAGFDGVPATAPLAAGEGVALGLLPTALAGAGSGALPEVSAAGGAAPAGAARGGAGGVTVAAVAGLDALIAAPKAMGPGAVSVVEGAGVVACVAGAGLAGAVPAGFGACVCAMTLAMFFGSSAGLADSSRCGIAWQPASPAAMPITVSRQGRELAV